MSSQIPEGREVLGLYAWPAQRLYSKIHKRPCAILLLLESGSESLFVCLWPWQRERESVWSHASCLNKRESANEERTVPKERSKIDSTVLGWREETASTHTSRIAVKAELGRVRHD
jgi:hypothetical protein